MPRRYLKTHTRQKQSAIVQPLGLDMTIALQRVMWCVRGWLSCMSVGAAPAPGPLHMHIPDTLCTRM